MITIITGLPGNGKTLYALWFVKMWAEKDNRPVFYSGINDLKLPWTEIDADKWFDAPPNSIVVIDECQRVFRPRTATKEVPKHVSELETHRHKGIDLVLITQHPSLADIALRRLAGKHMHVVRRWGTQSATVHEWPAVKDNCDKNPGRKDSIKHAWKYPKAVYEYYKSAEVHTVKRHIPMRVIMLFVIPLLLIGAGYYFYHFVMKRVHPELQLQATAQGQQMVGTAQGGVQRASYKNAKDDAQQFMFDRTPRVAGLPQTAPRYDEVTKPTTAPVPAACVANAKRCDCFTQQATPINVPDLLCRDIVARGYFVDFDDNGGHNQKQGVAMAAADTRVAEPTQKATGGGSGAVVAVLGDEEGYGVLGKRTGRSAGSK
ncbi:zonular occludens toxin domain-containing protein [Collimonas antrihumi]|uniref:zonular occludens toxin domain-containing protein n=1 Tax=Collimonas antrihumi TaxID=1940615 RepID=UPI001B8D03E4|nr:zonular occludens toxin domain-containing protein [Collimonas antrihumi]